MAFSHPLATAQLSFFKVHEKAGQAKSIVFAGAEDLNVDGARPNAFLHAYWNALMAYYMGASNAEEFATAHETYTKEQYNDEKILETIADNFPIGEQAAMDMHNNEVGRALAAKMPVGPTAPLTNMLVLETLLKNYYDGSMEKLNEAKKEYPGFSNAELLLLHYTADELTNGNLVWLQ